MTPPAINARWSAEEDVSAGYWFMRPNPGCIFFGVCADRRLTAGRERNLAECIGYFTAQAIYCGCFGTLSGDQHIIIAGHKKAELQTAGLAQFAAYPVAFDCLADFFGDRKPDARHPAAAWPPA